jgi:hypothetical protein
MEKLSKAIIDCDDSIVDLKELHKKSQQKLVDLHEKSDTFDVEIEKCRPLINNMETQIKQLQDQLKNLQEENRKLYEIKSDKEKEKVEHMLTITRTRALIQDTEEILKDPYHCMIPARYNNEIVYNSDNYFAHKASHSLNHYPEKFCHCHTPSLIARFTTQRLHKEFIEKYMGKLKGLIQKEFVIRSLYKDIKFLLKKYYVDRSVKMIELNCEGFLKDYNEKKTRCSDLEIKFNSMTVLEFNGLDSKEKMEIHQLRNDIERMRQIFNLLVSGKYVCKGRDDVHFYITKKERQLKSDGIVDWNDSNRVDIIKTKFEELEAKVLDFCDDRNKILSNDKGRDIKQKCMELIEELYCEMAHPNCLSPSPQVVDNLVNLKNMSIFAEEISEEYVTLHKIYNATNLSPRLCYSCNDTSPLEKACRHYIGTKYNRKSIWEYHHCPKCYIDNSSFSRPNNDYLWWSYN